MPKKWPDFLIGGVPRAATTSLALALSEHSNIFIPNVKEVDYFHLDRNWEKGDEWYKDHFPKRGGSLIWGEATPYYLCSEKACSRIKEKIPEVKLIFILRNPVERAYSHYCYRKLDGREKRSFEEVIEAYNAGNDYSDLTPMARPDYPIYLSFYFEDLKRYSIHFSQYQICTILMEDLIKEPVEVLNKIQLFLGVDIKKIVLKKVNTSKKPLINSYNDFFIYGSKKRYYLEGILNLVTGDRVAKVVINFLRELNMVKAQKPKLKVRYEKQLQEIFKPDIKKLSKLIKRDLSFWVK